MKPYSTERVTLARVQLGCLLVVDELGNNPTVVTQFHLFAPSGPFSQILSHTLNTKCYALAPYPEQYYTPSLVPRLYSTFLLVLSLRAPWSGYEYKAWERGYYTPPTLRTYCHSN